MEYTNLRPCENNIHSSISSYPQLSDGFDGDLKQAELISTFFKEEIEFKKFKLSEKGKIKRRFVDQAYRKITVNLEKYNLLYHNNLKKVKKSPTFLPQVN